MVDGDRGLCFAKRQNKEKMQILFLGLALNPLKNKKPTHVPASFI